MPDAPQPDKQLVPPSDLDAEGAVLSAAILDPARVSEVAFLRPEHFYATRNAHIWRAIRDLDAEGQVIDIVTVAAFLRDRELLDVSGGTPYLAQLVDATPAIAHIEAHARSVLRAYDRRRIIIECRRIASETYGMIGDIDDWKQEVDARIQSVTQSRDAENKIWLMQEATKETIGIIHERMQNKSSLLVGVTTGLPTLDARIGGLCPANKYVIAARPAMGKTSCATGMIIAAARGVSRDRDAIGDGVVFVSLEMPRVQIMMRFLSQLSRIDSQKIQRGKLSADEWVRVREAGDKLKALPIALEDSSDHTPASLRAAFRMGQRKIQDRFGKNKRVRLLAIDYLQLMGTEGNSQNREAEISAISRATKAIAKNEDIAVLELAQVNRECEKRAGNDKRPMLSDLRESGSIEQDAYSVMFLYREDVYRKDGDDKDNKAEIIVRKLRDNGGPGTVHCMFHPETASFYESSRDPDYEQLGDMFDDYLGGTSTDDDPPRGWQDDYDR